MRYVSIDIETLGLNIDAPIIEVACVFVDNGKILGERWTHVYHNCYDSCEPFAMSMHPKILRSISDATESKNKVNIRVLADRVRVWCNEFDFTGKITFAGKNAAGFDLPRLNRQTDNRFDTLMKPRHKVLDPGSMFARRGMESAPGLQTILDDNGVIGEVTHRALDDARAVVHAIETFFDRQA